MILRICVLQQQVPLPLPCFNFAQITIPSLTLKLLRNLCKAQHLVNRFNYVWLNIPSKNIQP